MTAGPVAVIPVRLLEIKWMGLWPSSAIMVALKLPEPKWLWMGTRSTTTMIAICSAFHRPSAGPVAVIPVGLLEIKWMSL